MKTVEVPADALTPGTVVQTASGAYGAIVMHGWDMEGSFGYFLTTGRDRDYAWAYHQSALQWGVWPKARP